MTGREKRASSGVGVEEEAKGLARCPLASQSRSSPSRHADWNLEPSLLQSHLCSSPTAPLHGALSWRQSLNRALVRAGRGAKRTCTHRAQWQGHRSDPRIRLGDDWRRVEQGSGRGQTERDGLRGGMGEELPSNKRLDAR